MQNFYFDDKIINKEKNFKLRLTYECVHIKTDANYINFRVS